MAIRSTTATLYTRLEDDDREWLEQQARENERSLAAELRFIVRIYRRMQEKAA